MHLVTGARRQWAVSIGPNKLVSRARYLYADFLLEWSLQILLHEECPESCGRLPTGTWQNHPGEFYNALLV